MASSGRKKRVFTEEETGVLLDLWADDRIQAKFNTSFRHNLIWEDIALRMKGMGYNRSWKECCNRVGNLKKTFARKKRDFEIGVADATDWIYWSHLESLFKTMPSSTQTVNEGVEDCTHNFVKEEETICDDYEEEDDGEDDKDQEIIMNSDTYSQMSDSLAVFMEDVDEYDSDDGGDDDDGGGDDDDADDDDDGKFSTQQSQIIAPTVPVQPSTAPSPHIKKKPMIKRSKRRARSDDYYIQQLIENDKQMLQNQQRQLQLDEQVSTAAVQLFNVMTEYLNKMNATMQSVSEVPSAESKSFTCSSSPRSKQNTVPTPGCSKLLSDIESSNEVRTTQKSDSDAPRTVRQVKRLCTTDISQNLKCNGLDRLINKVIVLPQEEELEIK